MQAPPTSLVYDISDLARVREKGGTRFTLRVPEFRINAGEMVAIIGSSGCGKSTLLDLLGLILPPTSSQHFHFRTGSGEQVSVDRRASSGMLADLRRHEIGYVLQHGALLPFLTVRQNAMLPQQLAGIRDRATVDHLLDRLGIATQAGKLPQHLSGGQRQRAAIARALSSQPPVVLCDEPTAAVDEITAQEIFRQLKHLSRSLGITLLIVTHNVDLVRAEADRFFSFEVDRLGPAEVLSTCHEIPRPA
jgi:putative ABC transport system ATP-binding protein